MFKTALFWTAAAGLVAIAAGAIYHWHTDNPAPQAKNDRSGLRLPVIRDWDEVARPDAGRFLDVGNTTTIRLSADESVVAFDVPPSTALPPGLAELPILGQRCVVYRHDRWKVVQMECAPILPQSQ